MLAGGPQASRSSGRIVGFGWTAANDADGRAGGRRTAGLARVVRAAAVGLSRARLGVLGIREAAGAHLRRCVAAVFLAMSAPLQDPCGPAWRDSAASARRGGSRPFSAKWGSSSVLPYKLKNLPG